MSKHVVFDVVGTCFSYQSGEDALVERLGEKLKAKGLSAPLLFHGWLAACERDYAYLIQMGKYATFEACFKAVFPRTLYVSGIDDPESFASKEDLDYIWNGYRTMSPRPGCAEMLQILRDGGYTVWCLSNASVERVKGLWDNHGMDMPSENILSADMIGVGKPDLRPYKFCLEKLGTKPEDVVVFAAGHAWDTAAAGIAGLKTAWTAVYENDHMESVYGKPDIIAKDLVDLGKQIVAKW